MKAFRSPTRQRGGFFIGLVVGLLIGLAAALGVALYVTKAPIPFINKVPSRSPAQDAAESDRNRNWDPNSALAGRNPAPGTAASGAASEAIAAPTRPVLTAPTVIDPVPPSASDSARAARTPASAAAVQAASARASQPTPSMASVTASPFMYFVQAGAYSRSEDAEQQRAKLALMGVESKLTEREQGGRMVYRVRVGPFDRREDAEGAKSKLGDSGVDAALVAVQK